MINALLLDDETTNLEILSHDLATYCPEIKIEKATTSPTEALQFLATNKIDVVFLDVTMPQMSGFDFLLCQKSIDYQVVFVTAHQEYALSAFDFYAVDYLVKPVSSQKLMRAVERLKEKIGSSRNLENIGPRLEGIKSHHLRSGHIAVPNAEGFEMIDQEEINYLQAWGNYTTIYLTNREIVVSKNLGEFEKILDESKFIRIHNSAVVQIKKIKKYIRGDGGQVVMADGKTLSVSRINKPKLLSLILVDNNSIR